MGSTENIFETLGYIFLKELWWNTFKCLKSKSHCSQSLPNMKRQRCKRWGVLLTWHRLVGSLGLLECPWVQWEILKTRVDRKRQGGKDPAPPTHTPLQDILKMEKENTFWDMEENWLHLFHNFQRSGRSCEKTVMKSCSLECQHWAMHLWINWYNVTALWGRFYYFAMRKMGILRFYNLNNRPGVHQPLDMGWLTSVSKFVTASTGLFINDHYNNSCNFCS